METLNQFDLLLSWEFIWTWDWNHWMEVGLTGTGTGYRHQYYPLALFTLPKIQIHGHRGGQSQRRVQ
jgi:hypothetical protein